MWNPSIVVRHIIVAACALGLFASPAPAEDKPAVKVFILAGQSNMVGAGEIESTRNEGKGSLAYLVKHDPKYKHLADKDGNWAAREDVQIWYFDRKGPLKAGYGGSEKQIGPELGFGWVVGEAIEAPVLLIKVSWGGKSIGKDFRPPSSGGEVGPYYTELVKHVKDTMKNAGELFPQFKGRKLELAGLGWHQGWNDRVNQAFNDAYEENLSNFIRDIRKELDAPKLPFVIAETGMSGHEEKHPRAVSLMKAQAAVAQREEFKGNVAFVGTKDFYRQPDESPANQAFHWNRNAETYYLIGKGMGEAMLKLTKQK